MFALVRTRVESPLMEVNERKSSAVASRKVIPLSRMENDKSEVYSVRKRH